MVKPEIVSYTNAWVEQFDALAADLGRAFGPLALRIDHIGSTAVPGLDAKDCIDAQVTVADVEPPLPAAVVAALEGMGLRELPYRFDHVPAGSDDDPARWRKRFFSRRESVPSVNLHVRAEGSPNQRFALLFRDHLRARPATAAGYAAAKRALATVCDDIGRYADVKDPIVDIIMSAAEEWAVATEWSGLRSAAR